MRASFALLLCCLLAPSAVGQTLWAPPYTPNQLVVEAIRPDVPNEETSLAAGALFLTGTHSFTDNVEIALELPVARYAASGASSESALGTPYVGVGLSSTTLPVLVELGARVPVGNGTPARRIGAQADVGRTPAFSRDAFSVSSLVNTRLAVGRQSSLRLRSGLTYTPASEDTTKRNASRQWHLHYGAQLWREGDDVLLGLSLTGRALLSGSGPDRSRSRHALVGSLMGNWPPVRPGLLVGLSRPAETGEFRPLVGLTVSFSYGR